MEPSVQWKRVAQVIVGKAGSGLLVDQLRLKFEIVKTVEPTPNTALIQIFNLHPNNETKIKNEFDEVILNAGYKDSVRLIFRGNIRHVFRYRDGNDYITEVDAADGDKDFRTAIMNQTLAAGTSTQQMVDRAVATFGSTAKGFVDVNNQPRIRGRVISGNTRDILHDIARESGANWSIQDGQLTIVKADAVLPDEAIVINANTGMIGAPEISDKGISVTCLLNPQIKINGAIQLNNNDIKLQNRKIPPLASSEEVAMLKTQEPVRLDPDGIYNVIKLTHKGDNRDKDWTTEIVCVGLSEPIPKRGRRK
jgi:hypothetical protein